MGVKRHPSRVRDPQVARQAPPSVAMSLEPKARRHLARELGGPCSVARWSGALGDGPVLQRLASASRV